MTGDPKLVAVVVAAVEAFLDSESRDQTGPRTARIGAWRTAARRPSEHIHFGRGLAWRHID